MYDLNQEEGNCFGRRIWIYGNCVMINLHFKETFDCDSFPDVPIGDNLRLSRLMSLIT